MWNSNLWTIRCLNVCRCCECVHRVNISRVWVEPWLCLVCCFDTDCSFYSFFSFFFLLWVFPCFFSLYNLSLSYCPLFLLWHSFFVLCSTWSACNLPLLPSGICQLSYDQVTAMSALAFVSASLSVLLVLFAPNTPKLVPFLSFTALPFTLGEVIIWSPARFVRLLTCKEIQSLIL